MLYAQNQLFKAGFFHHVLNYIVCILLLCYLVILAVPKPKNGKPRIQICKEIKETHVGNFVLMNNVVYLVFMDEKWRHIFLI